MQVFRLRTHREPLAKRGGTSHPHHQRLLFVACQMAMHQRFRAERFDQVYQQVQPTVANRQMFWPDADGKSPPIRPFTASLPA